MTKTPSDDPFKTQSNASLPGHRFLAVSDSLTKTKNARSVQQLDRVAAGRANYCRQPHAVAENELQNSNQPILRQKSVCRVGPDRRSCPAGLHAQQRVAFTSEVASFFKFLSLK